MAQIQGAAEADEIFDAEVKVLGDYIDQHVREERNEIFPKARSTPRPDLVSMRDDLQARTYELMDATA